MARPSTDERQLAVRWATLVGLATVLVVAVGMVAAWPVAYAGNAATPSAWWDATLYYFQLLASRPEAVWNVYARWYEAAVVAATGLPPSAWMAAAGAGAFVLLYGLARNPYSFADTTHGGARVASLADLKRRKLFASTGVILGRWGRRLIRYWEPLSVLMLAPPGTGKSVLLVANIIADWPDRVWKRFLGILPYRGRAPLPGPSMIINDPKGELHEMTAGWRSRLGPVFKLAWGDPRGSQRWNPLSPVGYPGGEGYLKVRGRVFDALAEIYTEPTFVINEIMRLKETAGTGWARQLADNPESIQHGRLAAGVSAAAAGDAIRRLVESFEELDAFNQMREAHVDRICAVLIPDTIEKHWRDTGREFLSGAIGYVMARCQRTGEEPTFGLLLDLLCGMTSGGAFRDMTFAPGQEAGQDGAAAARDAGSVDGLGSAAAPTGGDAEDGDLTAKLLNHWLDECLAFGYPSRVYQELNATLIKPDRERGSVISTAGAAINIFKNSAVRAATTGCSFRLEDLRGIGGRPVTIYVVVSLQDAEVLGRVTGLFVETVAAFTLGQGAKEIKKGRPILLIADEFWTLPPLQALLQIPAFGRGQRVQMILVGQSDGQIGTKYRASGGADVVATLKGATSNRVILTQTDLRSAKEISESIGSRTISQASESRYRGWLGGFDMVSLLSGQGGAHSDPTGRNIQMSKTGRPLFPPEKLMSMEKMDSVSGAAGWQLVQTTILGFNRPIECRPVRWWTDRRMRRRIGLPVKDRRPANS